MSNCHLVAGRSLIDLVASRLALRAPALRAATALTRPNRSAQRLPCGRRTAPTAVTADPSRTVAEHGVERGDHLTHHRHDDDLRLVASENSIHLTRSHRRIRTRSSDDCNRPLVRPYAVRLLQAATAAGSRNPNTAASAQRPAAAHAAPSTAFALDRPRPIHLALSSLPPHSGCNEHRQARDCSTLASQGFYRLLAMEIRIARGPAADRPRGARADPKNEF